jgi:hypothetical protein
MKILLAAGVIVVAAGGGIAVGHAAGSQLSYRGWRFPEHRAQRTRTRATA